MGYLPVRYDFGGLWTSVIASDGRPLPENHRWVELQVAPGERYDVLVRGGGAGDYVVNLDYLDLYDGHVVGTAQVPVVVTGTPTGIPSTAGKELFSVSMPTPSPTSSQVAFRFQASYGEPVEVHVFDVRGRLLRNERMAGGAGGLFSWDGKDAQGNALASGVYYFRFRHGKELVTRKVTLLR
jgi:hypothetical protein